MSKLPGKILILYEESLSGYQAYLAESLGSLLKAGGAQPVLIGLSRSGLSSQYTDRIEKEKPDLMITLDMAGFFLLSVIEDPYYDTLHCPFLHLLFHDPPELGEELFHRMNATMYFYAFSEDSCSYLSIYYKNLPNIGFLPFPGLTGPGLPRETSADGERLPGVCCPFPYENPDIIRARLQGLPGGFSEAARLGVDFLLKTPGANFISFLEDYFKSLGLAFSPEEFTAAACFLTDIPRCAQMSLMTRLVRELLCSGRDLYVAGSGWEDFPVPADASGRLLPALPGKCCFGDILKRLGHAELVLLPPSFMDASFPKAAFCAMLRGAVPLIGKTDFQRTDSSFHGKENADTSSCKSPESFLPVKDFLCYDPLDPSTLISCVKYFSDSFPENVSVRIAEKARGACHPEALLSVIEYLLSLASS